MATNGVQLSTCRIRKVLSGCQGKATIGSGCIITWPFERESLNPSGIPRGSALITTTQVVTKNDLISPSTSIVVEWLDRGNLLQFNLGFKYATDIPDVIPGRVLGGTGDALKDVAFIVIPVESFDTRSKVERAISFLKTLLKRVTSFQNRCLTCSHPTDEHLQASISSRKVLCHVVRDGREDGSFHSEPYHLEFGKDTSEFALTSPLDHDGGDDVKQLKDFYKEERPRGGLLLSSDGQFVGMLAIGPTGERKLFPLFLPTLDSRSAPRTLRKEDWNSQVRDILPASHESEIQPPSNSFEQTTSNEREDESRNNNQNLTTHSDQQIQAGNQFSTSEVQRSGSTARDNPSTLERPMENPSRTVVTGSSEFVVQRDEEAFLTQPPHGRFQPNQEDEIVVERRVSDGSEEQEDDENSVEEEEEDRFSEWNENVHGSDHADGQVGIRPNYLTQNSCYEDNNLPGGPDNRQDVAALQYQSGEFSWTAFSANDQPKSQELEHVNPGSLVKDTIVSKVRVMDMLAFYLDRSVCPGSRDVPLTQRWEHLADVFKVPEEKKSQCENFTGTLSPSENMFNYLCVTNDSLTIKTIKEKLKEIRRNDIVAKLQKNKLLRDEHTVADLCENHPDTLSIVCLYLDNERTFGTWQDLGIKLGITGGTLWTFKNPCGADSPSMTLLKKIETLKPGLRISTLEAAFGEDQLNLPAIVKVLRVLEDGSTIQTLLDKEEVLDKVTALLDRKENFWYPLGRKFGIERKELDYLKPEPIASPTKMMMKFIVGDQPLLSMKTFLEALAKINRFDVIKEMKKFFYASDIEGIVPRNTLR